MILACTLLLLMSISSVHMADSSYSESSNAPSNPPSPSGQGTAVGALLCTSNFLRARHCTAPCIIPWSWPGISHGATTPLPGWSWGSEPGSGLSAYRTGRGAIQGCTPGLHRRPAIMGSDPTRGRQCGHTGSTRRPGINGETPPTLSHTLAQVRPPTATRAGTRDRDPGRQDCTTCLVSWRLERLLGALDPRGPPSLILFFHPLSLSLSLTHSRPPILLSVFVTQFCFIS